MRDKTYRFIVDLKCHHAAGTELLRNFRVAVDAPTQAEARAHLKAIAFEMVADAGGDLLDGNLEDLDMHNVRVA